MLAHVPGWAPFADKDKCHTYESRLARESRRLADRPGHDDQDLSIRGIGDQDLNDARCS
jgi:hypothetical protein